MAMRDHHHVQSREVHSQLFDVLLEAYGIVSRIEQDSLAVHFDQCRIAPIRVDARFIGKRVVQNGHLILGRRAMGRPTGDHEETP